MRRGTVATFSPIVWCGNRPTCWITYPMRRRSAVISWLITSTPSIVMWPEVGSIHRLTIFKDVVWPQPDGPTRMQIFPAGTVSDRSLTAAGAAPRFVAAGSYDFETWSNSTTAPWVTRAAISRTVLRLWVSPTPYRSPDRRLAPSRTLGDTGRVPDPVCPAER